jgi:hypothetical protein
MSIVHIFQETHKLLTRFKNVKAISFSHYYTHAPNQRNHPSTASATVSVLLRVRASSGAGERDNYASEQSFTTSIVTDSAVSRGPCKAGGREVLCLGWRGVAC